VDADLQHRLAPRAERAFFGAARRAGLRRINSGAAPGRLTQRNPASAGMADD
jgi:hypothetical protein